MVGETFERVKGFQPMGVPVGEGILVIGGIALGSTLVNLVRARVAQIAGFPVAVGAILAYLPNRVPAIKRILGDAGTKALQIGCVITGLDAQFNLSGKLAGMLTKVPGVAPAVAAPAAPAAVAPTAPGVFVYGTTPIVLGSPPLYESDVERKLRAALGV